MDKQANKKRRYEITGYFGKHQHSKYGIRATYLIWLLLTLRPGAVMKIGRV